VAPALDVLNEALVVADNNGKVQYLNATATRLTGFVAENAVGRNLDEVFRLVGQESGVAAPDALDTALSSGDETRLHGGFAILTANEETPRPIVWSVRRVLSSEGNPRAILIVFRDPDEMSLTPEELLRINRFETLGVVAGGISHDFNNLLTTILGGISQAKDNKDYSYLADSERACLAAKALTKQLLAIAKGGKSEVIQTLSPVDIIKDAVRLGRAGTNAEIRVEVPDNVGPVSVDRAQILQVFQNLIINALQAMPPRGGTLRLAGKNIQVAENEIGSLAPGDYIRIEVQDNGCGIAPEHLEKIFEPFFTTKKQGTGLGLSMVRSIARKYSGEVTVTSTVGEGTTFLVYLPKASRPVEQMDPRRSPALRFGTGRVLLMDDDPDICHLAEGMLASLDYKYDIVRNGEEAVALYRRYLNVGRPYDAVILDLTVVGGAGGEETFHTLRGMDKDVRAIVCSGYDSEDMIQHYLGMGFSGYLTKPFRVADLGKVLKSVVG
jgi:PAS domain S-box-containing protein